MKLQRLVSLFLLALIGKEISALPNVYFLPGLAGNFLYATINSQDSIPLACDNVSIPIGESFLLYTNATLMLKNPDCFSALLSLEYDQSTGNFSTPAGISVKTAHFGREVGIIPVYHSFFQALESWGYEIDKTLFGIPYDFRFATPKSLQSIGFIFQLQQLIEQTYHRNRQKAILIGHSNGGPTIYSFLSLMRKTWKQKYLGGMITLSGNLLGQMNGIAAFFGTDGSQTALQAMATSWEATYTSIPWGDYAGLSNITDYIITNSGKKDLETHYSTHLQDMQALFTSIQREDWANILTTLYDSMDRRAAPEGLDVYCLYGRNVSTDYAYEFSQTITDKNSIIATYQMSGDGNQDLIDNEFCLVWKDTVEKEEQKVFESIAFDNVRHMQMYSNEDVLTEVKRILMNY